MTVVSMAAPLCPAECIGMSVEAIGKLMPMFLLVAGDGRVVASGPTLAKIVGQDIVGRPFDETFEPRRGWWSATGDPGPDPDTICLGGWQIMPGRRIHLSLRQHPDIILRGSAISREHNDGALINLTFGVHLAQAARDFALTDDDFAPSDLAMELLYLQEAKELVMGELRALNHRLEQARVQAIGEAMTDPLTGLANRRAFDMAFEHALERSRVGGEPFALAHLDLDLFKAVNDSLGHAAGDRVLAIVGHILREETRKGDVVARVGGDEFIMLLRGPLDYDGISQMGERIIARLEEPVPFEGQVCRISGSIGVVLSVNYLCPDAQVMLADADAALYNSKRKGRARCTIVA